MIRGLYQALALSSDGVRFRQTARATVFRAVAWLLQGSVQPTSEAAELPITIEKRNDCDHFQIDDPSTTSQTEK